MPAVLDRWPPYKALTFGLIALVIELTLVSAALTAGISEPFPDVAAYFSSAVQVMSFAWFWALIFGLPPLLFAVIFPRSVRTLAASYLPFCSLLFPCLAWSFCAFVAATNSPGMDIFVKPAWMSWGVFDVLGSLWWLLVAAAYLVWCWGWLERKSSGEISVGEGL